MFICLLIFIITPQVMAHLMQVHKSITTLQGEDIVFLATDINLPGRQEFQEEKQEHKWGQMLKQIEKWKQ